MNLELDRQLVQLSSAIYEPDWEGVERALPPGWHMVYPFDVENAEAMLCRRGADVVAAVMRGTEASRGSVEDLLSNLGSMTHWAGPGSVHSGYWRYTRKLLEPVLEKAKLLAGARFVVTGHSMGGAAAQLWAGASRGQIHIDDVVAFSPPRCMNREASQSVADLARCYTVRGDFVALWPPSLWYVRTGVQRWLEPADPTLSPLGRHDIDHVRAAMQVAV